MIHPRDGQQYARVFKKGADKRSCKGCAFNNWAEMCSPAPICYSNKGKRDTWIWVKVQK